MFNKKGEITTQQIVLLIILIVSFIIILLLIVGFDFFAQSDKEICHNSVVMRGTKLPDAVTPLKCSREYICISEDGSCEKMIKPEVVKVKTKEEIYFVLAEEMADCWWMFGEGKINYADPAWKKTNYCSICTQFVLDNSIEGIEGIEGKINQDEFYSYLFKTNMPNEEQTYADHIFGTNDINKLKRDLSAKAGTEVTFGDIEFSKPYFIVMGITSEVNTLGWIIRGAALGAVAAVTVTSGGFVVVAVGTVAGGAAGGVGAEKISDLLSPKIGAIVVEGDGINNKFMVPTIQEATSNEFKLLSCDEIITTA